MQLPGAVQDRAVVAKPSEVGEPGLGTQAGGSMHCCPSAQTLLDPRHCPEPTGKAQCLQEGTGSTQPCSTWMQASTVSGG